MIDAKFFRTFRTAVCLVAALTVSMVAHRALAANYPLELVSPRAVGTAPAPGNAAITANHRIFKAYPGFEYNIRAVVIGGAYPYTFALSNAPSGMTIHASSGLIVWPNPQANASPTITVTDSEGTRASSTWSIAVTTSGFKFVDAANGRSNPTGAGTITNPWRTISDFMTASAAASGDIVYFSSGNYDALNLPREGSLRDRVEIDGANKPVVWLARPGATPVIDFGFIPGSRDGVTIRFNGSNVYVDGFATANSQVIGFQLTSPPPSHYRVLRRLRMRDQNVIGVNTDGMNAAFIMTTSNYNSSDTGGNSGTWAQYLAIQDCEFVNSPTNVAIKTYSLWKLLMEDNVFRDVYFGTELKADMAQFTYRRNIHTAIPGRAIGGNMHSFTTHGEIAYNLVNAPAGQEALDINQDGQAKRIDVYRNTFVGRVQVRNVDSADGPFNFYNNVIVNSDSGTPSGSHITHVSVSSAARVTIANNLAGHPNNGIVDTGGSLTVAYSQYLGSRGFQLGTQTSQPLPPSNIIIE